LNYFHFSVNSQKPFTDNKKRIYIADFYIPRYRLIIELDGGYHDTPERKKYDGERDRWFLNRGYQVWRMTNKESEVLTVEDISAKLSTYKVFNTS
jgi:very-short-patch-repair endonuclease